MTTDAAENLAHLVDGLIAWSDRLIPDPERARALAQDLRGFAARAGSGTPLSRDLLPEVERICHRTARHLTLEWQVDAVPPDRGEPPRWPPVPDGEVAARAGCVRTVVRNDYYGLLRLDGLDEVSQCRRYLEAAFALLLGSDGLILDLRTTGGGATSALVAITDFILGRDPELIISVQQRSGEPRQWWTTGIPGEARWPANTPVAVLVGPGTYSNGEGLAYVLQTRARVRIFGERTPGAADHVIPVRLTPHVVALIPEGTAIDAVSGTNWEGVGVRPDVEVPVGDALDHAMRWLESHLRHHPVTQVLTREG